MKKSKGFIKLLMMATAIIVVITFVMAQNMGNRASMTTVSDVKITDPNLLAIQAKQNQLLEVQRQLEASVDREQGLRSKVEDAQASFRQQSVVLQAQHEKDRAGWQSTATFYERKWQTERRPVPWWATVWAGGLYGIFLVLALQAFHRSVKRAHGSYKKLLSKIWLGRPKLTWGGSASRG